MSRETIQDRPPDATRTPGRWRRDVRLHALLWLALANLVGVLLAAELVWPQLGDWLAPLSYGRWSPLHLDWQLYGWCSLPLVGALFSGFEVAPAGEPARSVDRLFQLALVAWSLALLWGGVSWLSGHNSGKLFLEWSGPASLALPAAMSLLWFSLAVSAWRDRRTHRLATGFRFAALLLLAAVPASLAWASGPGVYPAVNPDSGGATGTSLLGSTLGIVAVFGAVPRLLRVRFEPGRSPFLLYWAMFAAGLVVFAAANHHAVSHHRPAQIAALGSLVVWVPLAVGYFRSHRWTDAAKPWLLAAFVWWTLLIVSGWLTFLPGISERLKFTHALVGHAHLAMAGLVTSFHLAVLNELCPSRSLLRGFTAWQTACAVHVASLLVLGWTEAGHADALFRSEPVTQALLLVRLGAGVAMAGVSLAWFAQAAGACSREGGLHDRARLARALPSFGP